MSLYQLLLLVFCTVQVTVVCSWTVPDLSGLTQEELLQKAKELHADGKYESRGYTLEQDIKIRILLNEKSNDLEAADKICSVLVSNNFTLDRDTIQNRTLEILRRLISSPPFNKSEEAQFYKNVVCSYLRNPSEDVKHSEALELSMCPYFKFKHIRERNINTQSVIAARELCDAFYSGDNLANLTLNSNPIELSEKQLVDFQILWNQIEHLDWDKSPRLVVQNLCNLLDEKVSPKEQAKALEITVDFYSSVLGRLKQLSKDNSIVDGVDIYRQICRDINLNLGLSKLYVSPNDTLTTDDQIEQFSSYAVDVDTSENKWSSIENVCVYLNETVSIKYIAENSGLSDDQLAQHNSFMPTNEDYLKDNLRSQLLQTSSLCNVIKSHHKSYVYQKYVFSYNKGLYLHMGEFVFKASKLFSSPLNERLELLRGICLTTFPDLFVIGD